jgi:integrase
MGVYKRGETWWYTFTSSDGSRVQESARTTDKQAAEETYERHKAQVCGDRLGTRSKRTWKEAVVQWCKEKTHKRTLDKDLETFQWLDRFLCRKALEDIDRDLLSRIQEAKREETSESTANRTMEWEWIKHVPKVPMYTIRKRRIRFLTREETDRVLSFLPKHQQQLFRFALAVGLRQRNVSYLEWSQVDMERKCAHIHADQSKNGEAIPVPLNADAMQVLEEQRGQHEKYVFVYEGKPQYQVNTKAWQKALRKAGISDYRWHDNRHTWASWHVQEGTPLNVLQELGGWKSYEMVLRYAHLSSVHLAPHAERVVRKAASVQAPAGAVAEVATNLLQPPNPKVVELRKYLK